MQLFTKEWIYKTELELWKLEAFELFEAKLADQKHPFPCIPAIIGQRLNHFRYGFVSNPYEDAAALGLAMLLNEYSLCFKEIGNYTSLIIFFEPFEVQSENLNVEDYETLFWDQLNRIAELDSSKWPFQIPEDPREPLWEFCFQGEAYFMYCATPAHQYRNSRHFPYFILAITPRWALERFYETEKNSLKIKENIRKRLENYDSIPIHPALNTYGQQDNYEWKQYFLRDDDSILPQCPFHPKTKRTGD
ncbi:YqcI/YcgG family protein [Bacillus sp. BRMEA1]|uniref:YqcI/YcgG family protein n=1 Tax=Neobacillus endophyticus TaxID=2738405 RepID=UPI00156307F4|nr:YqcI/YcgG family protein [Neobacillus endophyticus]NRD79633.1 YqcI/YcgG family protein [Neobacillus endophyticus]